MPRTSQFSENSEFFQNLDFLLYTRECQSQTFCQTIGISRQTLYNHRKSGKPFSPDQMKPAIRLFHLPKNYDFYHLDSDYFPRNGKILAGHILALLCKSHLTQRELYPLSMEPEYRRTYKVTYGNFHSAMNYLFEQYVFPNYKIYRLLLRTLPLPKINLTKRHQYLLSPLNPSELEILNTPESLDAIHGKNIFIETQTCNFRYQLKKHHLRQKDIYAKTPLSQEVVNNYYLGTTGMSVNGRRILEQFFHLKPGWFNQRHPGVDYHPIIKELYIKNPVVVNNLRNFKQKNGQTDKQIAEQLHVTTSTINSYLHLKTGIPKSRLKEWAILYSVDYDNLFRPDCGK